MMLREVQGDLITLDDLARHVRLSARTIDRYLKKEGLQFRDLAQQMRFERACTLLAEPSATVAQVALRLGFSDAANFSRAFRRVFGMAPGEYQKRGASTSGA
jgi:AraC-like DNA-binding protein